MTTEREELATAIANRLDTIFGKREFGPAKQDYDLADALIELGYRKPRVIETAEDLEGLPEGSVVLDKSGDPWTKTDVAFWQVYNTFNDGDGLLLCGPLIVLHEGEA